MHVRYLTAAAEVPPVPDFTSISVVTMAQLAALSQIYDSSVPAYMDCYDPSPECDNRQSGFMPDLRGE